MRCAVLAFVTALASPAFAQELGQSQQAILDGETAQPSELRATVAVVDVAERFAFCTGTLVAPDVVITAAHCGLVIDGETLEFTGTRPPESLAVVAGLTNVSGDFDDEKMFEVADLYVHPDFGEDPPEDPATLFGAMHDIAVIVLARPVSSMTPVPILGAERARTALGAGRSLLIEGFGSSDSSGRGGGGILRTASIPMVRLGSDEFIAGQTGTPDTCPGDSGGPVYLDSYTGLALVGVTSRAIAGASSPCGEGGIYTLAPAYLEFIRQVSPSAIRTLGPDDEGDGEGPADPDDVVVQDASPVSATPGSLSGCQASPVPLNVPAIAMLLGLAALVTRRRGG